MITLLADTPVPLGSGLLVLPVELTPAPVSDSFIEELIESMTQPLERAE